MVLLLEGGHAVIPDQPPALVLSSSGRPVSRFVTWALAWCTGVLETQVGQEGRGETHQLQVYHGGPRRSVLVVAQPQQRLHVLYPRRHGPASCVRAEDSCGGALRGVGHPAQEFPGGPCARADDRQGPAGAHLQPARVEIAVAGVAVRLHRPARRGAAPATAVPSLAAGLQLPTRRAEAPRARACGGTRDAWRVTGLDHGGAPGR